MRRHNAQRNRPLFSSLPGRERRLSSRLKGGGGKVLVRFLVFRRCEAWDWRGSDERITAPSLRQQYLLLSLSLSLSLSCSIFFFFPKSRRPRWVESNSGQVS
ncbi:hypothetical protein LX32DRAFT_3 [Colletotrichum zoysiae]|uniref:Transmembrane protein n=1 Tax=Colletotrichum zoysiae TaxID=1216348 RepID=A0AAD9MAJ8_9PEZI|nr:hypothetical protein LX32DRAFT_3 [Colletotrichum zoysiae]